MFRYLPALMIGLLSVSLPIQAVDTTDYSQPQMKDMAVNVKQMQTCLLPVDEYELSLYESKAHRVEIEIIRLCETSQSALAQQKAIAFTQESEKLEIYRQLQNCTAVMREKGFLPPATAILQRQPDGTVREQICQRYHY